jgi:hypothetical protein
MTPQVLKRNGFSNKGRWSLVAIMEAMYCRVAA